MLPVNDLGIMNLYCFYCDALHWLNEHVSSSRIGHPEFGMCCGHGKIKLPSLQVPQQPLYNLFTADSSQGREFHTNIVQYNAALAFTSLGVKVDDPFMDMDHLSFKFRESLGYWGHCYQKNQDIPVIHNSTYMILVWIINIESLGTKICLLIQCGHYNVSCGIIILIHLYINMCSCSSNI